LRGGGHRGGRARLTLAAPVTTWADDRAALRAACADGVGLCTIVGIEGSFSRRLGAQLAVHPDGTITGSLADGCLEKQLASEVAEAGAPVVKRFGAGSELIDFRLPCGSGLDVLIDPAPDRAACKAAVKRLDRREEAALPLPADREHLRERMYVPALRLQLFGEGPELEALRTLATTAGVEVSAHGRDALSLGQRPEGLSADAWTAVVLLFHDHEWEQPILQWALGTPAFHIGAQGGFEARRGRIERLAAAGAAPEQLGRIHSPVGVIAHSREPGVLALSVLAEVVGAYEARHPHG
jgi:xanthine dehydrogenase accessory factor